MDPYTKASLTVCAILGVIVSAPFVAWQLLYLVIPLIGAIVYFLRTDTTQYKDRQEERQQRQAAERRVAENAPKEAELRRLWSEDTYVPPTAEEMYAQITSGFATISPNLGLSYGFAKRIKDVQLAIYAKCNLSRHLPPKELNEAITGFRTACIQGIVFFTRAAPKGIEAALPWPTSEPLFYVQKNPMEYLVKDGAYLPQAHDAFTALSNPMRTEHEALAKLGLPFQKFAPKYSEGVSVTNKHDLLNAAREADKTEWAERQLEIYEKKTEKLNEERKNAIDPLQWVFQETPYWEHFRELLPTTYYNDRFDIDPKRWFEGTWIVAPQGRGKTNLLSHLILHHLPNACIIVMDAKGDLIKLFSKHAPIKDRLVYFNPDPEYPLAINPLDIGHSTEFLEYIFALLNTEMTTNQSTLLTMVLLLCAKIPDANLETFRDILQNGWKRYDAEVRQLKKRDQDFFDSEWDSTLYKSRRPEVLARLRSLMATPALDEMLQSTTTKVDMGKLMDDGKVVLINNNYELLGDKGAEFFGRMFIALVWAAARKRTQRDGTKRPVFFFIDEAAFVIANDTKVSTIIQQCRSQNIAMVFAHQELQSIKNDDVKSSLSNCAIKFANPTGEASQLAPRLNTTKEFLEDLKQGQFATFVLDKTRSAVAVQVPLVITADNTLIDQPRLTNSEYDAVLSNSRRFYCYQGQETHNSQAHRQSQQRPNRDEPDRDDKYDDRYDMFAEIPLSPRKAREGTVLRVVLPNKREHLEPIQPGTKDGYVFRVKGASTVSRPDGTRGNYWVELRIAAMPGGKKEDWDV